MRIEGPATGISEECERVLRSIPKWFGIESATLKYVRDVELYPTFVCRDGERLVGFVTLFQHFPQSWEVHCLAVHADYHRKGVGRALNRHVEAWLLDQGARVLQVKTIAESVNSPEYAETRKFYAAVGYIPVEVFPTIWSPQHPALQLMLPLGCVPQTKATPKASV